MSGLCAIHPTYRLGTRLIVLTTSLTFPEEWGKQLRIYFRSSSLANTKYHVIMLEQLL